MTTKIILLLIIIMLAYEYIPENNRLKKENASLQMNVDSLQVVTTNLKTQTETYQEWIRGIARGVLKKCPEAFKGHSQDPELRQSQKALKIPKVQIRSGRILDQRFLIDGEVPQI